MIMSGKGREGRIIFGGGVANKETDVYRRGGARDKQIPAPWAWVSST